MDVLQRSDVARLARTKKLIGYGAGVLGAKTQRFLDGAISYFLDSSEDKWGREWEGAVPVKPPTSLGNEDLSKTIVVVCTEQYQAVGNQLRAAYPDVMLVRTPLLKEYAVFDDLLRCSRRLLISAYGASGGLYLVDGRTGDYSLLQAGSFRGMLTLREKLIVATERGDLLRVTSLRPFRTELLYSSPAVTQMHGLAFWEGENTVIAAEAGNDRLTLFDAETFGVRHHLPVVIGETDRGQGRCHVNDICVKDDSLFVSVISRSGWWKKGIYDGCVLEMDLRRRRSAIPVIDNLLFPHSINFIGDTFYILEAMIGTVLSGRKHPVVQLNGFLRGLDGHGELLYVGQARNRRVKEAVRYHAPVSMDSGVYIVHPERQVYRFLKLPEMCDVYNVLDLEHADLVMGGGC